MSVRMQEADLDLSAKIAAFRAGRPNIDAVASFIDTVRNINDGTGASEMELEHYSGMTEKALVDIMNVAMQRWELINALVIHHVDKLKPQDQTVPVVVASKHRGGSFAACESTMDYLKGEAPFWKEEQTSEGARWVDIRVADDKALARWGIASNNTTSSTADQLGASAQLNDYE